MAPHRSSFWRRSALAMTLLGAALVAAGLHFSPGALGYLTVPGALLLGNGARAASKAWRGDGSRHRPDREQ